MSSTRETIVAEQLLNQIQNSEEFSSLPPSAKVVFDQTASEIIRSQSANIINTTELESNKLINDIPGELVGPTNPVDVVSSNLTTNDLKTTINDGVGEKLNSQFTNTLSSAILNSFQNKLPPILKNSINLNNLKSGLVNSSSSALNTSLNTIFGNFASKTLSGQASIPPIVPDISSIFQKSGAGALGQVNQAFDSAISRQAITEAQKFNIQNSENKEKLITQTTGFIDPTATYPTKEYRNKVETNKLARGDVNGTVVQFKEKDRLKGIQLPNNRSWEQPNIPFNGEYPYNKVIQTEGGHIIELDDTPGCERIQVYHKSGTFVEIDVNGSVVKRTKGSSYEIIDRNGYISVTGDANLSVKGSIKIFVGGDADIEVEGDTNIKCLNDITMQAAGRVDISATEEINLHSANINIEADVNLSMKGDVNAFIHTKDMYTKANNNIFVESLNNHYLYSSNIAYVQTLDSYHVKAGSTIFNETNGSYNIKAIGDINEDGARVFLNSGASQSASDSLESKYSYSANIGLIGIRKDIVKETIADPVAPNYLDKRSYKTEDADIEEEATKQQKILKQQGIISKQQEQESSIPIETNSPTSKNSTVIRPDNSILTQTFLPENYQLSKHFTLAQLSTRAAVSSYAVVPQQNLTYGEIVFNLSGIALNVLEPLLALYPNMFVTSCFRQLQGASSTSDHTKGKAVDVQFKGVAKADYFEIAKKLAVNLNYDKLLLEYKTYGTGMPWIHISFDINAPRKIVLTYLNDKKYGDGLTNLT